MPVTLHKKICYYTNRCTGSITELILKLKLLRHDSLLSHHLKGALDLCQLKLWIIEMINIIHQYVVMVKCLVNVAAYVISICNEYEV
jgi:hypothetical protein